MNNAGQEKELSMFNDYRHPGSGLGTGKFLPGFILLWVLSAVLVPSSSPGQAAAQTDSVLSGEKTAEIREILRERVDKDKKTVGIVVGVINDKGSQVIGYGRLDKNNKKEVDGNTVFEIGSITKVFTTLLLAEMAEKGELSLEDRIAKFLPDSVKVPTKDGKEITLLHLATHTSGLPRLPTNFFPKDKSNPYADYTADKLYEFLSGYTLKRDIGEKVEYSNLGGGLLGHLLSLKAGTDYETLVITRICEPLGMNDTRITLSPELKGRMATGYDDEGKAVKNWDLAVLAGAGALRSTANDLLKFLAANLGLIETGLAPAMQNTQAARRSMELAGNEIALGWIVGKKFGTEIIWHNGGTGGYRSFIGFRKDKRLGVVVLCNSANSMDDIGFHLLENQYPLESFAQQKEIKVNPEIYRAYAGYYELSPGTVFEVTAEEDKLMVRLTGQPKLEVFPKSETEFFYKVVDAQITFQKDTEGKVTQLILHQGGLDLPARKLGNDYQPPLSRKEIKVDPVILKTYVGEYELTPGAEFTVGLEGDKLTVQFTGQSSLQIFPESEAEFFYKEVDAQITFEKDENGKVTGLILHQGGEDYKAKKIK